MFKYTWLKRLIKLFRRSKVEATVPELQPVYRTHIELQSGDKKFILSGTVQELNIDKNIVSLKAVVKKEDILKIDSSYLRQERIAALLAADNLTEEESAELKELTEGNDVIILENK